MTTTTTETARRPTAAERYARERFELNLDRLRLEIRLGTPRRNIDVALELCEWLVDAAGSGRIVDHYRAELGAVKAGLAWRASRRRGGRR